MNETGDLPLKNTSESMVTVFTGNSLHNEKKNQKKIKEISPQKMAVANF